MARGCEAKEAKSVGRNLHELMDELRTFGFDETTADSDFTTPLLIRDLKLRNYYPCEIISTRQAHG